MQTDREYKNIILTNHARERLDSRSITVDAVHRVVEGADFVENLGNGKKKFIRTLNGRLMHVVAHPAHDSNKWVVISVWVRGENDKQPLSWILITLPFKIIWMLISLITKFVKRYIFKMYK